MKREVPAAIVFVAMAGYTRQLLFASLGLSGVAVRWWLTEWARARMRVKFHVNVCGCQAQGILSIRSRHGRQGHSRAAEQGLD